MPRRKKTQFTQGHGFIEPGTVPRVNKFTQGNIVLTNPKPAPGHVPQPHRFSPGHMMAKPPPPDLAAIAEAAEKEEKRFRAERKKRKRPRRGSI